MRLGRLVPLLAIAALFAGDLRAETPEKAPAESRAQVAHALEVLAPAFAGKSRQLAAGAKGSIEHVISSFAPGKFHPVDEGTLPSARTGAKCPADMALVASRFCIDRYEGSLVEKQGDGSTKPYSPYNTLVAGNVYLARSVAGVVPQGYISARQAESACKNAGKRLCKAVEWRAACGGSEGYAYPYGPTRIAGKCKDSGSAPMMVLHGGGAWSTEEMNDPKNNQLEGGLGKTGAFTECVNDFGVYDMVGNLHEWTADANGTFQGGYWLDTSQHGDGCAYRTIAHSFDYHDYSTGFRCCGDIE
jgi:sulfatase modifying factor 1